MLTADDWDHVASIQVDVAADDAFAFMRDARNISQWALGALYPAEATQDTYVGYSMIDGQRVFVKVDNDPLRKIINFQTGPDWDQMETLISCHIVEGGEGNAEGSCILSLSTHRASSMSLGRWKQLCASHEVEMFIIKNRIEPETRPRPDGIIPTRQQQDQQL